MCLKSIPFVRGKKPIQRLDGATRLLLKLLFDEHTLVVERNCEKGQTVEKEVISSKHEQRSAKSQYRRQNLALSGILDMHQTRRNALELLCSESSTGSYALFLLAIPSCKERRQIVHGHFMSSPRVYPVLNSKIT
jgi:hypothetical protein